MEISLKPLGREEIHKLETALLVGTLLRKDVLEAIRSESPVDRLTWLDSLAVAAGALARERAGLTIPRIAEELGRTEATIRNHLAGRTEAGRLVRETYERFKREGVNIPWLGLESCEEERRRIAELEGKIERVKAALESLLKEL